MKCEYCERDVGHYHIIYEDEEVIAAVKDTAVIPGQVTVFPKQHYTILEMVPDQILTKCMVLANKVGIAIFESQGAQGTNVIIKNGLASGQNVPHFSIEIIPRREADGLNLLWEPKPMPEDELEATLLMIKEQEKATEEAKQEKKVIEVHSEKGVSGEMKVEEKKDNYMIKAIRRLP